ARTPRPPGRAARPFARCRAGRARPGAVRPHARGIPAPVLRGRHPGCGAVSRRTRLDRDRARGVRGPDRAGGALDSREPCLKGRTISGMTALGVSLLIVGAILILVEAHVPTLGVLGGPGVIALGVGAVLAVLGLGGGVLLGVVAALMLAGAAGGVLAVSVGKGIAVR